MFRRKFRLLSNPHKIMDRMLHQNILRVLVRVEVIVTVPAVREVVMAVQHSIIEYPIQPRQIVLLLDRHRIHQLFLVVLLNQGYLLMLNLKLLMVRWSLLLVKIVVRP